MQRWESQNVCQAQVFSKKDTFRHSINIWVFPKWFSPNSGMQWTVSKSKISINTRNTLCLVKIKTYYSLLPPGRRAIIKVNNFPKIVYWNTFLLRLVGMCLLREANTSGKYSTLRLCHNLLNLMNFANSYWGSFVISDNCATDYVIHNNRHGSNKVTTFTNLTNWKLNSITKSWMTKMPL